MGHSPDTVTYVERKGLYSDTWKELTRLSGQENYECHRQCSHIGAGEIHLLFEYWGLLQPKLSYKDGLSNIMGVRFVFLIAENYRDQSHDAYEISISYPNARIGFPAFSTRLPKVKLIHNFRLIFWSLQTSIFKRTIYWSQSKQKCKKGNSTKCCFTYEISDAEERAKT